MMPGTPWLARPSLLQNPPLHLFHTIAHLPSLLPICRRIQDFKAFNSLLIVHGLIRHHPLVQHFIHRCCLQGFPDLSLPAFKSIQRPSLSLQNLLLRSLSDHGLFQDTLLVYQYCRSSGILSDNYTYPFVIKACAGLRYAAHGNMIYCCVIRSGFGKNVVIQTAMVDFYFKVGEIGDARKLFDEIPQPDLVAWNALISGYSLNGYDYKVLQVLKDMFALGVKPNESTLASVFPVCSRAGVNGVGTSLHGLAYKVGYNEEQSLVPALISVYANYGDALAAGDIFDSCGGRDVAAWNAIISAYVRCNKPEKALAVFQTMLTDGVKPNTVTFVSLVPCSENLGSVYYVASFHGYVVKFGFEKELAVITALISAYAKAGNLDSGVFLFGNLRIRNLLLWNSMVSAYAGQGLWEQSLNAFRLMQRDGYVPDAISIISLVCSCSELNASVLGKSAHGFSIRKGIDSNVIVSNSLLAFYCCNNEFLYAFRLFEKMAVKNTVTWNTIISGCVNKGEFQNAMLVFDQMRRKGVQFDLITLISILPSCHKGENPMFGLAIHCYSVKTSLATDISMANALTSMYLNCEDLDAARLLFNEMPDRSVVSWNAIFTGYRLHNLAEESIELFYQMIREDQKPNYVTLLNVLPACNTMLQGKSIHGYIVRRKIPLETPLLTTLMIMYARFKSLTTCLMLFNVGDKTNISLWNTVISVYLILKNGSIAFSFFLEMLRNDIAPDGVTVLNVISACLHMNNLHISNSVLAYLVRKGFDKNVVASNALIDLYAKCGNISNARILFDAMPQKDVISWSVMINAYGLHGDIDGAMSLYSQMTRVGLKPDKVMYMSLLSACSHAGCVDQGRMIFDSMICEGVQPGAEHYACMVDLLGRTGHLNEAYKIIRNLQGKSLVNMLESLLGACLSHGNFMLGEEIGRLLLELNPKESRSYVILHNIYAAAGKWVEAEHVRMAMEQCQLRKAPGISVVDGVCNG